MFQPGDTIVCDYQIDAVPRDDLQSVEASILWYTVGKGEEDMGIHFFERRMPADAENNDLRAWRRFESVLPNSPLSYDGDLVQLHWCVQGPRLCATGKDLFERTTIRSGKCPGDQTCSDGKTG